MTDPGGVLSKSLRDFKNNPVAVVPVLFLVGFYFLMSGFIVLQFFVGLFLFENSGLSLATLFGVFFLLLDLALFIIIISYCDALQFGTIADAVSGKKTSFKRMLRHGKSLFGKILGFNAVKTVFMIVVDSLYLIPYFIQFRGNFSLSSLFSYYENSLAANLIDLFISPFLIILSVMTLFVFPLIVAGNLSGFRAIFASFNYVKSDFGHVFTTAVIVIAIWVVSIIAVALVSLFVLLILVLLALLSVPVSIVLGVIYAVLLVGFFSLLYIFTRFFIFNSYLQKNRLVWK